MNRIRIFISSVQKEFAQERKARVIVQLTKGTWQKSELSKSFGQKAISARLNEVVRELLFDVRNPLQSRQMPNAHLALIW